MFASPPLPKSERVSRIVDCQVALRSLALLRLLAGHEEVVHGRRHHAVGVHREMERLMHLEVVAGTLADHVEVVDERRKANPLMMDVFDTSVDNPNRAGSLGWSATVLSGNKDLILGRIVSM